MVNVQIPAPNVADRQVQARQLAALGAPDNTWTTQVLVANPRQMILIKLETQKLMRRFATNEMKYPNVYFFIRVFTFLYLHEQIIYYKLQKGVRLH